MNLDNNIFIEDIISNDFSNITIIKLLENKFQIALYLTKYINEDFNIKFVIKLLKWLCKACEHLAIKIDNNYKKIKNNNMLVTSSYNFCEFGYECKFFYSKDKKCNSCHYPYDILFNDILTLQNNVEFFNTRKKKINNNEMQQIKKSIKTVYYVINHMFRELTLVDIYSNENAHKFHKKDSIDKLSNNNNKNKIWTLNL